MPTIETCGHESKRTSFSYRGSHQSGVVIEFESGDLNIDSDVIRNVLYHFRGLRVAGGFSMSGQTPGSVGEYLSQQNNSLTPRHTSFLCAILQHEGKVNCELEGNAVVVKFNEPYSIEEHRHRFAAWAAGRAANVKGCRFKVEQGKQLLEDASLHRIAEEIDNLPRPEDFDSKHLEWRNEIIRAASEKNLTFTHGVAAKLINMYLKSVFVCGGNHDDVRVKAIHPPIDGLLLDALYKNNVGCKRENWQLARKIRWSKLNSVQYQNLISAIREMLPEDSGLWQVEEYWQGYQ